MGLQDPRLCIAIILQDPALLEGTIRDNLNPTNEYIYNEVWAAISAGQICDPLNTPTEKYVKSKNNRHFNKGPWIEGVCDIRNGGPSHVTAQTRKICL
ncbi:hypothetical protein BX661DRAFT_181714 [Kickxella alabastrina]|uniref:uncharacterized protein n=1 Tax=Kickxella alabastrina TaxID=61397 RepID=UPI00221E750E|nr:uncharacterized protein BX661DRAFT_181714 [Kickxella alabastrina]KAI7829281.1 hypothetical protein BX661DRAFT_181714 [Kickxella alabastrina]